jgi:hypothetical protein
LAGGGQGGFGGGHHARGKQRRLGQRATHAKAEKNQQNERYSGE